MSSETSTADHPRAIRPAIAAGSVLDGILARFSGHPTCYRMVLAVIYFFPIMTFTMPGRESPSALAFLDPLALVKVAILAMVVLGGALLIYVNRQTPALRSTLGQLAPFFLFLSWAIVSVIWSPLKGVSLGQAGGLCGLLFYCVLVAMLCRNRLFVSRILKHLCYSLIAYGMLILMVYSFDPAVSGLDRTILLDGGDGMIHPTAAGAAASLGLLIATLSLAVMRFPWAPRACLMSVAVNAPMLILSNSRAAILMAGVTIPGALYVFGTVRRRAMTMLWVASLSITYLVCDPGFTVVHSTLGSSLGYLSRGQSIDELRAVSGRTEMWSAIWDEYQHAPVFGHGYFVTSTDGKLAVWNVVQNHTAHNLFLQVLVSTGGIGLALFLGAMLKPIRRILTLRKGDLFSKRLLWLLGLTSVWYLGWTMGCVSFMGPVRSESVAFFTLLGIGIGDASGRGQAIASPDRGTP